eukprot:scaffold15502_cov37-Phaeocystis_antarctica.AAC.1
MRLSAGKGPGGSGWRSVEIGGSRRELRGGQWRWAEEIVDGRRITKELEIIPEANGGRRSTHPNAPAARPRAPYRTPGVQVACRALRCALAINTYSRARAAAFPHGMRVVALGAVPLWGLGASKSVRAGGRSTDRNEGVLRRAGGVRGGLGEG